MSTEYARRVAELEAQGLTTSDAQGVADCEGVADVTPVQLAAMRRYIPRGDMYALAGDHNSSARQAFMLALTGNKLPKSKCGVTALGVIVNALVRPAGDCIATRENNLAAFINASTGA